MNTIFDLIATDPNISPEFKAAMGPPVSERERALDLDIERDRRVAKVCKDLGVEVPHEIR